MEEFLAEDWSGCLEKLRSSLSSNKGSLSNEDRATVLLNTALCEFKLNLYRKSLASIENILKLKSHCIAAYRLRGEVLMSMGKPDDAIAAWRLGLEIAALAFSIVDYSVVSETVRLINDAEKNRVTAVQGPLIAALHAKYVAALESRYGKDLLALVRNSMSNPTGDAQVDEIIAVGYLSVNTGQFQEAVTIFRSLNAVVSFAAASHIGLGSALAILGQLDVAIECFSRALEIDATIADAWKRRGQTRVAREDLQCGVEDLTRAIELLPTDGDCFMQRGLVYSKMRCFQAALHDFELAVSCGDKSAVLYNNIGMCHMQLGNVSLAAKAFDQATQLDAGFIEAYLNKGRLLKEAGMNDLALVSYQRAIEMDKEHKYAIVHKLRAQLHYASAAISLCVADLDECLASDPRDVESWVLRALCFMTLGDFRHAIACFNTALSINSQHPCVHLLQLARYYWSRLDDDLSTFNIHNDLAPAVKDALCKCIGLTIYSPSSLPDPEVPLVTAPTGEQHRRLDHLLVRAVKVMRVAQLRCIGFVINIKQHVMFGVASLQAAVALRRHVSLAGKQTLTWRSLYEIAVRWRQVAEINDNVYWIDGFPADLFREGFGLTTPMVNGELKTMRYYCYCSKAIQLVKRLLLERRGQFYNAASDEEFLSEQSLAKVPSVESLDDLYSVVGKDFYIVTTCHSRGRHATPAEGTRVTLLKKAVGYEFTIRTPGTPPRWEWFDGVLTDAFDALVAVIQGTMASSAPEEDEQQVLLQAALHLYYYFICFAPLARGSAMIGCAILNAALLSIGLCICDPLPKDTQLDWEAIFAPSFEDFLTTATACLRIGKFEWDADLEELVWDINTYRKMMQIFLM